MHPITALDLARSKARFDDRGLLRDWDERHLRQLPPIPRRPGVFARALARLVGKRAAADPYGC